MQLGTLASIWRYPIKSLRGEALAEAEVAPDGIAGDRTSALIVENGHARVGKTYRGKESNALHLLGDTDSASNAAKERGVDVTLDAEDGRYFDDAPISILIDRWLDGLSAHVGFDVEPERFRPNFFVRAARSFSLDEAALTGRELFLGEVVLRVRYPIERCVTTTYDQTTGESDPRILQYVAANRSTWMGVYCDVLRAGTTRIGDSLALAER
ncbi:MAG: MOSC domain-containing protein [Candidatus Eremiobacteraeota bacterium]|nr:MOSC domain-containing protein [Candidatus Eremiobacteraeota bacterium]